MAVNNQNAIQKLTLLNWNANGLKTQRSTFISFVARHDIDIACVTETHLIINEKFTIPGYKIYRKDREAAIGWGGSAIILKKNLVATPIDLENVHHLEAVAIKLIMKNNTSIKIVSAYKPPNKQLLINELTTIFENQEPTLLIGDLNSKHINWGCRKTNPNGVKLNNITAQLALHISAPTEHTYFPYRTNQLSDILDIILHKNLTLPIRQTVLTELDSDHLPIICTLNYSPNYYPKLPRLIEGPVDWDIFRTSMNTLLTCPTNLIIKENIDKAVKTFTEATTEAIHQATITIRRHRPQNHVNPPAHILHIIREKHATRRLWQNTRDPVIKARLNELIRLVRDELDKYRIDSYNHYIENP